MNSAILRKQFRSSSRCVEYRILGGSPLLHRILQQTLSPRENCSHPGNILLLREDDGSPAIGLIDYGQVKKITKETRHLFAKLLIALDDDNKDEVFRLMKEAGMRTKNMDPEVFYLYARVNYDEINEKILGGKHVQMFMEALEVRVNNSSGLKSSCHRSSFLLDGCRRPVIPLSNFQRNC